MRARFVCRMIARKMAGGLWRSRVEFHFWPLLFRPFFDTCAAASLWYRRRIFLRSAVGFGSSSFTSSKASAIICDTARFRKGSNFV
jgi:hypothetical protein